MFQHCANFCENLGDECRVKLQRMRGFCDVGGFLVFLLARLGMRPIFAPPPLLAACSACQAGGFFRNLINLP
jgi:hypothetical protein